MRRGFVPVEVAAVLVAALVASRIAIPIVVPLLAIASLARWVVGGSLLASSSPPATGPRLAWYAGVAALAGLAALGLALAAGTPIAEALTDRAVVWTAFPIVRGNPGVLAGVVVVVAATALASELVLRGWIVERVLELGGPPVPAILVGALAEGLLTDGNLDARLGAALVGIGLGWMYVAAGRRVWVPICARLVFALGALALEATRLVG